MSFYNFDNPAFIESNKRDYERMKLMKMKELSKLLYFWKNSIVKYENSFGHTNSRGIHAIANNQIALIKLVIAERIGVKVQ